MINVVVHALSPNEAVVNHETATSNANRSNLDLSQARKSFQNLLNKNVEGSEWLGWLDTLTSQANTEELDRIQRKAAHLQAISDIVLCIGIGGSYLGAAATIAASLRYEAKRHAPDVRFVGTHLGATELKDLMAELEAPKYDGSQKKVSIIVISKSGSTVETGVTFRILRAWLKTHHPGESNERIVAITSSSSGSLRTLADAAGYDTFVVPGDVGGRFSVLSPVGLLPIAVAGLDIHQVMQGAHEEVKDIQQDPVQILTLASARKQLMDQGYAIECLSTFDQECHGLMDWVQQLQGESEGKDSKGLFPAKAFYSRDLHSLGQWVQDGPRILFETVISLDTPPVELDIPRDDQVDGFEDLAQTPLSRVNESAKKGTIKAHCDDGIPVLEVELPDATELSIGAFFTFYMVATGVMGDLMGVNAYNQPGVEAYKKEMITILNG
ncbi:MAG: glucose-6-phosphate isomerase [Balneolaceae bacterium]|nr:glucose-6-phosphate isomerase [Balneolaceae bacterium]